jgi:zinc transporter 5/7
LGPNIINLNLLPFQVVLICALKALFLGQTNPSRTRGLVLLVSATLILMAFDHDQAASASKPSEHPEGGPSHHGLISHLFYSLVAFFDVSDHKAGVLLLVATLLVQTGVNQSALSKVLTADLGGAKRLRALSLVASAVLLSPWAIFNLFSANLDPSLAFADSDVQILPVSTHSWLYFLIPVLLLALFTLVIDFYVESYVAAKTDPVFTSRLGALFVFTCSVGLSFVWNHPHLVRVVVLDKIKTVVEEEHALSWGVVIAYGLFCLSTEMLSRPMARSKGSFIGYSSVNGNPLYSLTGENLKKTSMSMVSVVKGILREVLLNKDSRGIFYFLCLNLTFCFVELGYGVFTNSKLGYFGKISLLDSSVNNGKIKRSTISGKFMLARTFH